VKFQRLGNVPATGTSAMTAPPATAEADQPESATSWHRTHPLGSGKRSGKKNLAGERKIA